MTDDTTTRFPDWETPQRAIGIDLLYQDAHVRNVRRLLPGNYTIWQQWTDRNSGHVDRIEIRGHDEPGHTLDDVVRRLEAAGICAEEIPA